MLIRNKRDPTKGSEFGDGGRGKIGKEDVGGTHHVSWSARMHCVRKTRSLSNVAVNRFPLSVSYTTPALSTEIKHKLKHSEKDFFDFINPLQGLHVTFCFFKKKLDKSVIIFYIIIIIYKLIIIVEKKIMNQHKNKANIYGLNLCV